MLLMFSALQKRFCAKGMSRLTVKQATGIRPQQSINRHIDHYSGECFSYRCTGEHMFRKNAACNRYCQPGRLPSLAAAEGDVLLRYDARNTR